MGVPLRDKIAGAKVKGSSTFTKCKQTLAVYFEYTRNGPHKSYADPGESQFSRVFDPSPNQKREGNK
jgi:hypothetical protein